MLRGGFFQREMRVRCAAILLTYVSVLALAHAAFAQDAAVTGPAPGGDSQTTVHGYAQPTVQGHENSPVQERTTEGVTGDQGPKFEGYAQRVTGTYNDPPAAIQESVKGRGRPEYDPNGIQLNDFVNGLGRLVLGSGRALPDKTNDSLGGFVLDTTMEAGLEFDSNLYRTEANKKSDASFHYRPGFTIASDWNNDSALLDIGADIGRYNRNRTEDYQDYHLGLSGRLDMYSDDVLVSGFRFDHQHAKRGTPDDPGVLAPTLFDTYAYNLGYHSEGGTQFFRSDLQAAYYDYLHNGGVENDDKDRYELTLTTRVGTELTTGTKIFIEPSVNTRRYIRGNFNGQPDNSSQGGQVLAGLDWDYSGVTFLEFGAGYLRQTYDDPQFSTIQGPTVNAKMTWNATELLTFTGSVNRTVQETVIVGESGDLSTLYTLTADWEALYNLIVDAGFSRSNDAYRGISRTDVLNSWTTGARYLLNQNWYAEGRFFFDKRTSDVAGSGFSDQRFIITVGERL
jgi:hypothetical protein